MNASSLTEEEKFAERKRDIVVLVLRFLADYGFGGTYRSLCNESGMSLNQIDAADNIDLMAIVQEFVEYFHSKFGRYPKLVRQAYPLDLSHTATTPDYLFGRTLPFGELNEAHLAAFGVPLPNFNQQQQPPDPPQSIPNSPHTSRPPSPTHTQPPPLLQSHSPLKSSLQPPDGGSGIAHNPSYRGPLAAGQHLQLNVPPLQPVQPPLQATRSGPFSPTDMAPAPAQGAPPPSTFKLNTIEPVTQGEFVTALASAADDSPAAVFDYKLPSRNTAHIKRSRILEMSERQEEVCYALAGCLDVGWSIKNLEQRTKQFLSKQYGIDNAMVQLFFKNRTQRVKKTRRGGGGGQYGGSESCSQTLKPES